MFCLATATLAGQLNSDWITFGDCQWQKINRPYPLIKQSNFNGTGKAINKNITGRLGVWRCLVEPGPRIHSAGFVILAGQDGKGGLECLLGGTGENRGFLLRNSKGKILWSDPYVPWECYEPYVLETVVQVNRVRVQMLSWNGTLLSQSDWISVNPKLAQESGHFGLMTEKGIARFWNWTIGQKPMAEMTPNAPNKLRLVEAPDSPWRINGGLWQWTDTDRRWIRQSSCVERAWAILQNRPAQWTCRVKVLPPAGGAGMVFNASNDGQKGLLCWLGGQPGAGSLNFYLLQGKNKFKGLWAGQAGKWRYNQPYILQGKSKNNKVRIRLLAADDGALITESPWIKVPEKYTQSKGVIGFHTWRGPAEFGHFGKVATPKISPPQTAHLGENWRVLAGRWQWGDEQKSRLVHQGPAIGQVINTQLQGIRGNWQCKVNLEENAEAHLLFQVSNDGKVGFAGVVKKQGDKIIPSLIDLENDKELWNGDAMMLQQKGVYLLDARTTLDRVRFRLQSNAGKILADSGDIYVSSTHNDRVGHLGLEAERKTTFCEWNFKPE